MSYKKLSKRWYLIVFLIQSITLIYGQNWNRIDIPFTMDGKQLKLPYTGGIRGGQFSNIDFNDDGLMDLFVFDRNGSQIIPLVKTGEVGDLSYRYAPEYISIFPSLRDWCLLVDFNKDGAMDIFTSSNTYPGSVEVWKGKKENSRLTFQRLTFNYGIPEILTFPISNGYAQIYVSTIDLPSVVDIDFDGDMDMVSFEADGSYANYYQNVSVEENLGLDSLKYVRKDICWGKFAENQFTEDITLSSTPFGCASGFTGGGNEGARHSGSTLCVFDSDGDDDMDLVIGDLASTSLKRLINGGDKDVAFMTSLESNFPVNDIGVNIEVFLGAFYVDVDSDGKRDLIATTNEAFAAQSFDHVWLYKNIGTDKSPIFKFVKKDFLIDEMVFFNSASRPLFIDVNADGLQDIIMGSNGKSLRAGEKENRMYLLLNIGSKTQPSYKLQDDNYLNFMQYTDLTGRFSPSAGDLDGDGDLDLVIGDIRGSLYFLENTAGKDKPMEFKSPLYEYFNIAVGSNANPQIVDLDGDGLNDLLIGEKNNQLNFFKNVGNSSNPKFVPHPDNGIALFPNSTTTGNIFPSGNDFNSQSGSPFMIKQEGKWLMLFGVETGNIRVYNQIENNIYGDFNLKDQKIGNINEGRKVNVSLANIDGDEYYEMVVGNERGGITFYNTIFKVDTLTSTSNYIEQPINIYPNPASSQLIIELEGREAISLIDMQGRIVKSLQSGANDISDIPSGLYLVQISQKGNLQYQKLMIHR